MHGPNLTYREIARTVDHAVKQAIDSGVPIESAIRVVGHRHGLEPDRVTSLIAAANRPHPCSSDSSST